MLVFFFVKQKTAYEMRISDWSSDVCSSDLRPARAQPRRGRAQAGEEQDPDRRRPGNPPAQAAADLHHERVRPDLLRDHPAQGQRRLRRGQLPGPVREHRARPDEARRAVTRAVAFGPLSLRERAGVRVRRNDARQTTAANNHAREPTHIAPSPAGRGLGRGYGEMTPDKPTLPTTTPRNARRCRSDLTDAQRNTLQHTTGGT